jgi:alpha-mannosidase
VLEVTHRWRRSVIRQRITFYRRLARVDFRTTVDWRERGDKVRGIPNLKIGFTAKLAACEAWYEIPFGAVARPADGQESVALRWADVGGPDYGFALLNDSKHGYDALGSRLRLTLLRSSYEPDAIPDLGRHEIAYALLPHPGDWREARVVEAAAAFNQPLLVTRRRTAGRAVPTTFRPILTPASTVQIATLKAAQAGTGTVIRLYESGGRRARVTLSGLPPGARVRQASILEALGTTVPVRRGRCTLVFRPWQIMTLVVEPRRARGHSP